MGKHNDVVASTNSVETTSNEYELEREPEREAQVVPTPRRKYKNAFNLENKKFLNLKE